MAFPDTTDEELIRLYRETGDENFVVAIHERHYPDMVRACVCRFHYEVSGMEYAAEYVAGRAFEVMRINYRAGQSVKQLLHDAREDLCAHVLRRGKRQISEATL